MDTRTQRALHIAATVALAPIDGKWKVPSQTGSGTYTVKPLRDGSWFCSCPDHDETARPCKHIIACDVTAKREAKARVGIDFTDVEKPKYTQDWPAYNKAQTHEKADFLRLLHELCSTIEQPAQVGPGPRKFPLADMVFCTVLRTYVGLSGRRFQTDLNEAAERGFIDRAPTWTSAYCYAREESMTAALDDLIALSATPLKAIETEFAVDSSGFGTCHQKTWFSTKHGRELTSRLWRKAHVMCGTSTHIITAAKVTPGEVNDAPLLPELARATAKSFDMVEVSADKGYLTKSNAAEIEALGATPFIPFKSNSVEPPPGTAWARMYHLYSYNRDEFNARYHRRSNVETVFHMVKSKFGEGVSGKTEIAQDNEVLAKLVAHNICCLIMSAYELGIESDFAAAITR